jgi:nucleotide-binding universal stress UspA family protein
MNSAESPQPVVVGIDGSDAAIGAAQWGVKEAIHRDVSLRLVHVIQAAGDSMAPTSAYPAERDYAESSLRAACLAVEATGLPVKIDTAVLRGDVDSALIAESKDATLMCVGSLGISRVASRVVGSTASTLAEHAQCPVAIIRRSEDWPMPEGGFIAAVLDHQPGNDEVIEWAMEEARVRRAPVLVLGVWRWALFKIGDEEFYRRIDHWLRRYPDVEVEVASTRMSVTRYLEGRIGRVQLAVIDSVDANRVAQLVGARKLPIFSHADCSVLIVRGQHQ